MGSLSREGGVHSRGGTGEGEERQEGMGRVEVEGHMKLGVSREVWLGRKVREG